MDGYWWEEEQPATGWRPATKEELRAFSGERETRWVPASDEEQRAYERGRARADEAIKKAGWGPVGPPQPEERQRVTVLDGLQPVAGRNPDYEQWRRTPAGRLHALVYPDPSSAYEEHRRATGPEAVRKVRDDYEVVYGRQLPVQDVRAYLNCQGWERGQGFAGTAEELQAMTRFAFPDGFTIRNKGDEPPSVNEVGVYSQTPEGIAAMRAASIRGTAVAR